MSFQNNNAVDTYQDFMLPTALDSDFSSEDLADDMDGLQLTMQRVKIPGGGNLQFEIRNDDPDNPDYERKLVGVLLYHHLANAYWPEGSEYDDNVPPFCQSFDGKQGYPAAQLLLRRGHSRNLWALRPKKKSGRNLSCGHGNSTGNRKSLTIRVQVGIFRTLRLSCHKRYAQISITRQLYHKILWLSRKGQLTATRMSVLPGDIHTPEAAQNTAASGARSQRAPTGLLFLWNVRFLSAGAHPAQHPPA